MRKTVGVLVGAALATIIATPTQAHTRHHHKHRHYAHHHHRKPVVEGMNHDFVDKLTKAFATIDSGSCRVGSGYRSHAEQARLHRARPGLAARPGHSNHERGLAADLSCTGNGLHWMHAHAGALGLIFPMAYEPWHIEPVGATRYASRRKHYAHRHHYHVAKA